MIETLLNALREAGTNAAEAKARYDYLEYYRKHLVASLMKDAERNGNKTISAQEREAYASAAYADYLEGLREAQIQSANAGHRRQEAELAIEVWRTKQANLRLERKAYNA